MTDTEAAEVGGKACSSAAENEGVAASAAEGRRSAVRKTALGDERATVLANVLWEMGLR